MVKPLLFFVSLLIFCFISAMCVKAENYGFDSHSLALKKSIDSIKMSGLDYWQTQKNRRPKLRETHPSIFKVKQIVAPIVPLAVGTIIISVGEVEDLDESLSDQVSSGRHTYYFDDYLQYSPAIIMYGLSAIKGVNPTHKFKQQTTILALAALTTYAVVQPGKYYISRKRPDSNAQDSFPSGHTATAFLCAEMLHQEFRDYSPWISILGYSLAAATGFMRVYNDRHYFGDVIAGAGAGILGARIAYWVAPRINQLLWGSATGYDDDHYSATIAPCTFADSYGVNLSITF